MKFLKLMMYYLVVHLTATGCSDPMYSPDDAGDTTIQRDTGSEIQLDSQSASGRDSVEESSLDTSAESGSGSERDADGIGDTGTGTDTDSDSQTESVWDTSAASPTDSDTIAKFETDSHIETESAVSGETDPIPETGTDIVTDTETDSLTQNGTDTDTAPEVSTGTPTVEPPCQQGEERPCPNAYGACAAGVQTCEGAGIWSACSITPASADTCDEGNDADCNGSPNENCVCINGKEQPCGHSDVGECRMGRTVCVNGDWDENCVDMVGPQTEQCDSGRKDEDCDGEANEYPECLDFTGISGSDWHTCASATDGLIRCWGIAINGVVGPERDLTYVNRTALVPGDLSDVVEVAVGYRFACARTSTGVGACWGDSGSAVGDGTGLDTLVPVEIFSEGVISISAHSGHACALLDSGQIYCWGDNGYYQTGEATGNDVPTPQAVSSLTGVTAVATGGYHTCLVRSDGSAYCFGLNQFGQCGGMPGTGTGTATPIRVNPLPQSHALALGTHHSCAITNDREVYCWGDASYGQLGNGATGGAALSPERAGSLTNIVQITAGGNFTCALTENGDVYCWGADPYNQTEVSLELRPDPFQIEELSNVRSIGAGEEYMCAVLNDGSASCWGNNNKAQLGKDGDGFTPAPVLNDNDEVAP